MHSDEFLTRLLSPLRVALFYLFSVLIMPVVMLVALVSPGTSHYYVVARIWVRGLLRILGARLDVCGARKVRAGNDYVFVANHRSHLDAPAIARAVLDLETRWVAKKELRSVPVLGPMLVATNQIFIDRGDNEQAVRELERRTGERGITVVFFGEGSRSRTTVLRPFKKGAAAFAIATGLPLVPVAISGAERCLPKGTFSVRPGVIRVVFGDPIDTSCFGADDRGLLTERARADIETMLGEIEEHPLEAGVRQPTRVKEAVGV